MRSKKIIDTSEMSEIIKKGMTEIHGIVARTLGPGGLPIILEREGTSPSGDPLTPQITKDGVTVAQNCEHPDPAIDLVIQSVKAICIKTNRLAGDGTTTAIVLGNAILQEAIELTDEHPEKNPQLLREEIEAASKKVQEMLKARAVPANTPEMIENVATISCNGDREIGGIIRKAFEEVGAEGVITVDEGHSSQTTIDVVEGFQIRRGAEAQLRFFNNADNTAFEAENTRIIIYDGKLTAYTELLPPLNLLAAENQKTLPPVVIVANEFSPEVIMFLLMQRAEMGLRFCAVKSPDTTSIRTEMLDDMAISFKGYRFGNGNRNLGNGTLADIGSCEKVVIDKYTATFYEGAGTDEEVLKRVEQLKALRNQAESPYDAQRISDRIAALSQGIAKIGVGGATDFEIKERYHRIEDALNAARAAVEEGIIPGGGIILAGIGQTLWEDAATDGERVVAKALLAPFEQILENIGLTTEEVVQLFPDAKIPVSGNTTYDARNKKVVDALVAGIIDPVKVTRIALENATSIAALLSTCGGGIIFTRDDKSLA